MVGQISQYVLKVHSRCDLACDHCYVYEHADQSWQIKPRAIPVATAGRAADRIAEHASRHQLPAVRVVLHGGEPLLLGLSAMRAILQLLATRIGAVTQLELRIHTNGVLLTEQWCTLFSEYRVRIGISLDGDKVANDRHRRFANGRSSYDQARRALQLLRQPEYRELYAGVLCTIDLENDPIKVYEALLVEEPPNLDLLLPHATWDNPPKRLDDVTGSYGAWLACIFARWTRDGRPVPIRLFNSLLAAASGRASQSESVGLEPADLLVIDTDGSWEQPDSLKTAYDGAASTGLEVFSSTVDEVVGQPGFRVRLGGAAMLSADCRECEIVQVCGGGLYAHRYRSDNGFDNPTVYCRDMKELISQMILPVRRGPQPGRPAAIHRLPPDGLESLASGPGDVPTMAALAEMELSINRALIGAVARAEATWQDKELERVTREGWEFLCALEAAHRDVVAEVLAHPYLRVWAEGCLRPSATADPDLDRAHLAGFAAAVAVKAGVTEQVRLPIRDQHVYVPTIGALRVGAASDRILLAHTVSDGLVTEDRRSRWLNSRKLSDGILRIAFEDLDPYRDCQAWPAADRRSATQWDEWSEELTAAGRQLAAALPRYAKVISAGLRAVVPLHGSAVSDRSATSRMAFGAIALAPARQAGGLAALLLHEFQHVKLHALIEMHELFDQESTRRMMVPWRGDPRPVEGVLHGTYAYLALAHLDQTSLRAAGEAQPPIRSWVRDMTEQLLGADVLTTDGHRFVARMRAAVEEEPADDD
jgi:uncharacterized protein